MDDEEGFRAFNYAAEDGLQLAGRVYGKAQPGWLTVVCLPGLTRNSRDFDLLARRLAGDPERPRRVVTFDYRGRGRSAADPNWRNYDVRVEANDVIRGLAHLSIEEAAFIGTSRGGLILHVLAATHPAVLKAVILNDIGPVIEAEGLRHIRAYLDGAEVPRSFREAVAAQKRVHGPAFPALGDADWERFVRAIYRDEGGVPVADFDPALLNAVRLLDPDKPIPALWPQFEGLKGVPLLIIRGENSRLLSAATLAEMARRHPDCRTVTVAGQGHAPFLETGALPETIGAFLAHADDKASV